MSAASSRSPSSVSQTKTPPFWGGVFVSEAYVSALVDHRGLEAFEIVEMLL